MNQISKSKNVIDDIKELYFSDDILQADDICIKQKGDAVIVKVRVGYDEITDERMELFLGIISNCNSISIKRYDEATIDISFEIPND